MDDFLKATMLYDFYGELLTDRQKVIFEMYYLNDFSLAEIGQELEISRQAVRDQIKRTEKILFGYEDKLKLVEKFNQEKTLVKKIKDIVESIEQENGVNQEVILKVEEIKKISDEILN